MLLKDGKDQMDLVEVFCSPTSSLTKAAQSHGLKAERWTKEDFDLSRPSGCQLAMDRLRQLRPKRLWLSPECGPYSIMQNANQKSPQQAENLRKKRELAFRQWQSCIRLAWLQVELGGTFYIEQPQRCMSWQLKDQKNPVSARRTLNILYSRSMLRWPATSEIRISDAKRDSNSNQRHFICQPVCTAMHRTRL